MAFRYLGPVISSGKPFNKKFYANELKQSFIGGEGSDTVSYEYSPAGISIDLSPENGGGHGLGYGLGYGLGKGSYASGDTFHSIENIIGSNHSDSFKGNFKSNRFTGLDGDDLFYSSKGNDSFLGGGGVDWADYSLNDKAITVRMERGEVNKGTSNGTDHLSSIEKVSGSDFNDVFYGDENDNIFYGNDGDDYFYADEGADAYDGGEGFDTVDYSHSEAGIDMFSGEGLEVGDRFTSIEQVIGSQKQDVLIASEYGSTLVGNAGNDSLLGLDGDDIFLGGVGDDLLWGDAGDDTLSGGDGDDSIYGGVGDDTLSGGEGNDSIEGYESDGIDTVVYENNIVGGRVQGITVDLELGTATDGWGDHDTLSFVENVTGTAGHDDIIGDNKDNVLKGQAGDDKITGGDGNDSLFGGAGADTFIFANNDGRGDDFNHGQDVIEDFEIGQDRIDLDDTEVRNFDDLFSDGDRVMVQEGADAVIYTIYGPGGDSITLKNIDMADLTEDSFIF